MRNSINPKSPFLQHSTKLRFLRQRMIILIRHLIYFSRVKSIKAMLWENRESKFNDWGDYLGFFFKYQKLTTQLNWIEYLQLQLWRRRLRIFSKNVKQRIDVDGQVLAAATTKKITIIIINGRETATCPEFRPVVRHQHDQRKESVI